MRYSNLAIAGLLAIGATHVRADTIISNLPGNDGTTTFINAASGGANGGGSFDSKAAGFTLPSGSNYTLDAVNLRLNFFDTDSDPVVGIYSNSAGQPGTSLITLNDPAVTVGTGTFAFTPASPFTLQAGDTYWVVASDGASVADSYQWLASIPPVTPTGIATSAGYVFEFGAVPPQGAIDTVFLNSYSVLGTVSTSSTPEPGVYALLGSMGLMGAGFIRRRRSS